MTEVQTEVQTEVYVSTKYRKLEVLTAHSREQINEKMINTAITLIFLFVYLVQVCIDGFKRFFIPIRPS